MPSAFFKRIGNAAANPAATPGTALQAPDRDPRGLRRDGSAPATPAGSSDVSLPDAARPPPCEPMPSACGPPSPRLAPGSRPPRDDGCPGDRPSTRNLQGPKKGRAHVPTPPLGTRALSCGAPALPLRLPRGRSPAAVARTLPPPCPQRCRCVLASCLWACVRYSVPLRCPTLCRTGGVSVRAPWPPTLACKTGRTTPLLGPALRGRTCALQGLHAPAHHMTSAAATDGPSRSLLGGCRRMCSGAPLAARPARRRCASAPGLGAVAIHHVPALPASVLLGMDPRYLPALLSLIGAGRASAAHRGEAPS